MNNNRFTKALSILLIVMLAIVFMPVTPARAATTYTSNATGNWTTSTIWTPNGVPVAGDTVIIASPNVVTLTADAAALSVTINSGGSLTTGGFALTVDAALTNNGTITAGASIITVNGSFLNNSTFNEGASTVVYGFSGAQSVASGSSSTTFYNLSTSGGGLKTLANNVTIVHDLTVGVGTDFLVGGSYQAATSGVTSIFGTLTHNSFSSSTFAGLVTIESGGTWTNSGNAILRGGLRNNGTFNAGTGVYTFDTNSQTIDGTSATTIANLTVTGALVTLTNNCTAGLTVSTALSGTGTLLQGTNAILTIGGTSTITTLNASTSGNTVNYTDLSAQVVKPVTYHHLGLSDTGVSASRTLTALTTINGDLTISGTAFAVTAANLLIGGNLVINSTAVTPLTIPAFTITVNGNTTVIDGALAHTSAAGAKTYNGDVTINSGGTWSETANPAFVFGGNLQNDGLFTTTNTGIHTFIGATKTFSGVNEIKIPNVTITGTYTNNGILTVTTALAGSGTLTQGNATDILTIGGTVNAATTLIATASGNTVIYNGALQVVRSTVYQNLTLGGSSTKDTTGSTVNGILSMEGTATVLPAATAPTYGVSATIQYNKLANAGTVGVEWPATFSGSGGVVINGTGVITLNAAKSVDNSLTINSGAKLTTAGFGITTVVDLTNHGTLTASTSAITVGNNLTNGGITAAFTTTNLSIITITGGDFINSGTFTPVGSTITIGNIVNGNFNNSGTFTANNVTRSTLKLSGDLNNTGTITSGTFNLTLSGTKATQSIAGFTTTGAILMEKTAGIATFMGNVGGGALTINGAGGTLSLNAGTHTFTGTWTQSAGTLDAGSSTLNLTALTTTVAPISKTTDITGGTFIAGTGTVAYNGATQTVAGLAYNNLTTSVAGVKTTGGNLLVGGNLTVVSGTFTVAAHNITVNGTTLVTGTLTHSSATGTKIYKGLVTVNGTWTNSGVASVGNAPINFQSGLTNNGTFNAGTGVYTFDTNDQTVTCTKALTIANVTVNVKTLTTSCSDLPAVGVESLTVSTALSGTGTLAQGVNSILNIGGTSAISTLDASASGNIVNYTGAAAQTVNGAASYYDITLSGVGAKTMPSTPATVNRNMTITTSLVTTGNNLTIAGNLLINSGTLTVGAHSITVTGTTTVNGTLTHTSFTGTKRYVGLVTVGTVATAGTWTNSGNASINLRGGLMFNGLTFTAGTGNYTFDTNDQVIGGTKLITITNLIVNNITLTNNSTLGLTVTGTLSGASGLPNSTLQQGVNGVLNISGVDTMPVMDVTTNTPNTVNYPKAGAQTARPLSYSNLGLSGGGAKDITGSTVNGNLTLTTAATTLTTTSPVTIGGNLTIGTVGAVLTVGGFDFTVNGTTSVIGTLIHNNSTGIKTYGGMVTVTGIWNNTGNSPINFRGGLTYNGTTFTSGTGAYTFETNAAQMLDGIKIFTITNLAVSSGVTLTNNVGTGALGNAVAFALGGTLSGAGEFEQGVYSILNLGMANPASVITVATFDVTTNVNAVNYSMLGAQTLMPIAYNGLTLSGSGAKSLLTSGVPSVAGTLTFAGTVNEVIPAALTPIGGLTMNNTAVATLSAPLTVTGNVNISAANAVGTLNAGANNINVGGNWTKNLGTFTSTGTGTVTLYGSAAQLINGNPGAIFNNLTIAKSALSGTVSATNTIVPVGLSVVGTGTSFTTQLAIGNVVYIDLAPYTVANFNLTGKLGVTNGSQNVTGSATKFLTQVSPGDNIYINSVQYTVNTVTNDTALSLTTNYTGATVVAASGPIAQSDNYLNLTAVYTGTTGSGKTIALGVTLQTTNPTVNGKLTLTDGVVSTGGFIMILGKSAVFAGGDANSYVIGNLRKVFMHGLNPDFKYALGDGNGYRPLTISHLNVAGTLDTGYVTATTNATYNQLTPPTTVTTVAPLTEHRCVDGFVAVVCPTAGMPASGIDKTLDVNRYWTLTPGAVTLTAASTYDMLFEFTAAHRDALTTPEIDFGIRRFQNPATAGSWSTPILGTRTPTSVSVTGMTTFGTNLQPSDYVVGKLKNAGTSSFSSVGAVNDTYGNLVSLSATLAGVIPLDGNTVTFAFNGVPVPGSALTDINGLATLPNVVLDANEGIYGSGVTAIYAGTNTSPGSSATASLTVGARPITLTAQNVAGNANKAYDGTTDSAIAPSVTSGGPLVSGDTVSQSYDTKDVGVGKTITPNLVNDGNNGDNYTVTPVTTTGDISAKALTISGVTGVNRDYDGTTAADLSGTPALVGVVSPDVVTVAANPVTGTFGSKHVGTGKTVTPDSLYTLGGADLGNYTLTQPTTITANIAPLAITLTAQSNTKSYDGTTSSLTLPTVTGGGPLASGDTVSQSYDTAAFGSGKTLTPNPINDGNPTLLGSNYTLTPVTDTTGAITVASLTVTADNTTGYFNGVPPIYTFTASGFASGEDFVSIGGTAPTCGTPAAFNTYAAALYPDLITCSGGSTGGNANYSSSIAYVAGDLDVTTRMLLTVTSNETITYGGTPAFTPIITGYDTGENASFIDTLPTCNAASSAHVGSPHVITCSGGFDAAKYDFDYVDGALTVNAKALTITANSATKGYGATKTFAKTEFTAPGLEIGDSVTGVTLTSAGAGSSAAIGTYTIVPSAAVGTGIGNYAISYVNGTLNVVSMTTVTYTSQKIYDGWVLASSGLNTTGGSFNPSSATINVGDNASNRQYRSILHFNTNLPAGAVISSATLKLKKFGVVGKDPLTTHGALFVNMSAPAFGSASLAATDFEAMPSLTTVAGTVSKTPAGAWYSAAFTNTAKAAIPLVGATQFRLRFSTPTDGDSLSDYLQFYSGSALLPADYPQLVIEYFMPTP